MSVSINGSGAITYNDGSTQANAQVGMKNRIIDGGFIINQRAYISNTALSAGVYAHDRWKAGASGCTYTFTQGSLGVNTTITITAGTLVQVIEGCNLAEGGTYVLSWTGTAQGRLNGGTYGSSGTITVTGWTAGTNLNVEFNTGTVGSVQLEKGSTATSFDYRPYTTELQLCQRYLPALNGNTFTLNGYTYNSNANLYVFNFPVTARVAATGITVSSVSHFRAYNGSNTSQAPSTMSFDTSNPQMGGFTTTQASGFTIAQPSRIESNNASAQILFTGCEL